MHFRFISYFGKPYIHKFMIGFQPFPKIIEIFILQLFISIYDIKLVTKGINHIVSSLQVLGNFINIGFV